MPGKAPQLGSAELRASPRKKVLLTGKVVWGKEGRYSLDCEIRDISAGGARIGLANGQPIPQVVFLIDIRNRVAFEAEVASDRAPEFGLKFRQTFPLGQRIDPSLSYLRRIWFDCAR